MNIMKQEDRIKYIPGYDDKFFYVDSSQLKNDIAYIKNNDIENLILYGRENYCLDNIDWLSEVSDIIKWLIITPAPDGSFSFEGLKFCKNLTKIKINNYSDEIIDLTNNNSITRLDVENYKNVVGLEYLINLETLILNKPTKSMIESELFSKLLCLSHLSISNANLENGLDFLSKSHISSLELYSCKKLSLRGIEHLNISSLEIEKCKNVIDLDCLYSATNLREIKLIDSVKIKNPSDFVNLKNLEVLIVLGTSWFIEGNLNVLKNKLYIFNYDNKRHYNIKWEEFKDAYLKGS